jgi:hypothetical protein
MVNPPKKGLPRYQHHLKQNKMSKEIKLGAIISISITLVCLVFCLLNLIVSWWGFFKIEPTLFRLLINILVTLGTAFLYWITFNYIIIIKFKK